MLTTLIGAIVNIVLDPVFIFGLEMDIAGAAVATVIAQMSSYIEEKEDAYSADAGEA